MFKVEVTGSFYIVRFNNFGKGGDGGGIPSLANSYYVHTSVKFCIQNNISLSVQMHAWASHLS